MTQRSNGILFILFVCVFGLPLLMLARRIHKYARKLYKFIKTHIHASRSS